MGGDADGWFVADGISGTRVLGRRIGRPGSEGPTDTLSTDHVELKALTSRREQVERRLKALQEESTALNQKISAEHREISGIDAKIFQLQAKAKNQTKSVLITEHAILRYLERVKGLDLDQVKKEMVPELVTTQIRALGNGEYPVGTHTVKVKDNTVITILTKEEKEKSPPAAPRTKLSVATVVGPKNKGGTLKCLKCEDLTDRLLKGGLCLLCVQEGFSLE